MKLKHVLFTAFALCAMTISLNAQANQPGKTYQQMSRTERSQFVSSQAHRLARELSGRKYEFTAAFIEDIQQSLNRYTRRITVEGEAVSKHDLKLVIERGHVQAPAIIAAFKSRNVSPLFGLYLPWIESEYINITSPTPAGSIGMFQFIPKTGELLGLTREELLDVNKAADAAARYIADNMNLFANDPMKEALALLSYNRGEHKTAADVKMLVNDSNRGCSICALSAGRTRLDASFQNESVYYVPLFFAAAIIGENPQAFGLNTQPLSAH
jgi:Transglycosylase SLT domain